MWAKDAYRRREIYFLLHSFGLGPVVFGQEVKLLTGGVFLETICKEVIVFSTNGHRLTAYVFHPYANSTPTRS